MQFQFNVITFQYSSDQTSPTSRRAEFQAEKVFCERGVKWGRHRSATKGSDRCGRRIDQAWHSFQFDGAPWVGARSDEVRASTALVGTRCSRRRWSPRLLRPGSDLWPLGVSLMREGAKTLMVRNGRERARGATRYWSAYVRTIGTQE